MDVGVLGFLGAPVLGTLHRKKLLTPLFAFLIFLPTRKEVLRRQPMAMGELFTVTVLISIALMIAAYWQSDDDGGLV
jgi:hypothetical protein